MENKIKTYVEEHIYEQLEKDSIDFELKKNTLINRIIKELSDKISIKSSFSKTNINKSLVFNLNKENTIFNDWTNIIKIQNYETIQASHQDTVGNNQTYIYRKLHTYIVSKSFQNLTYNSYQRGNNHQLNDDTDTVGYRLTQQ